eukprot:1083089-Pelagomonas_calceolata.AAC.5
MLTRRALSTSCVEKPAICQMSMFRPPRATLACSHNQDGGGSEVVQGSASRTSWIQLVQEGEGGVRWCK